MAGLVKTGQAVTCVFVTQAPATGAATNADSLPAGTLYVDGAANGATVTVTNITTGVYKAAVTLPTLTAGQIVDIRIAATVSTVAGNGIVWSAVADTYRISDSTPQTGDSFARIGALGAGLTAVGDTAGTTTLLSRLSAARAGYLDNLSAGAVALASALTTAQADLTTLVGRITGAVALATSTTAAAIRSALGMAAADLDTQLGDLPTNSELAAGLASADDATLAAIAARPSVADFWSGITATAARFIADHTLRRSWASAAVSANGDTLSFRSLLGAVAKLVNRVGISGATLTVYQDDDTTALGEQTLTSDAAAEPITQVNTV